MVVEKLTENQYVFKIKDEIVKVSVMNNRIISYKGGSRHLLTDDMIKEMHNRIVNN